MSSVDGPPLLHEANLSAWLDRHVPELGDGPLQQEVLGGGATNVVIAIDRGGTKMVLRRPPATPRPDSEKVLLREARLHRALNQTDVPAPRLWALCEDQSVIGATFCVMSYVDGWCVGMNGALPEGFDTPAQRRELCFQLVDGIARLARVDYRSVGLEGFGRPEGFLERQVDRWLAQHASYGESEGYSYRPLPGLDQVVGWLRSHTPESTYTGIIHGDYGFANAMFRRDPPAVLAAMIDWELATIGDPLLDLGWVLYSFKGRDDETDPPGVFHHSNNPSREELADYYQQRTGRAVMHLTYYMILAQFKLAMLLERHYARGLNGRLSREMGELMGGLVLDLLAAAAAMAWRNS
jgi:aminoglycoside phosphotransferase (APT) family kinase protein